nr:uncharacterized protein LOC116772066 [Danaus plexippus plexippus]
MKIVILLSLLSVVAANDHFYYNLIPLEVTALAKNPKQIFEFLDCLLDKGPCNDVFEGYRAVSLEAVQQACKRCTADQKRFVQRRLQMNRYKMKIFITLAALVINAVVAEEELYDLPLLDMREIARNPDQLKSFLDCLLDRAPCNPLYQGYRDLAPESIRESCRKCTPALKIFAYVFFTTLKTFLPEEYQNFRNKYDPDNIYIDRLEEEVRKYAFGTFSG